MTGVRWSSAAPTPGVVGGKMAKKQVFCHCAAAAPDSWATLDGRPVEASCWKKTSSEDRGSSRLRPQRIACVAGQSRQATAVCRARGSSRREMHTAPPCRARQSSTRCHPNSHHRGAATRGRGPRCGSTDATQLCRARIAGAPARWRHRACKIRTATVMAAVSRGRTVIDGTDPKRNRSFARRSKLIADLNGGNRVTAFD